ncbi:MAG: hypothetical protein Q4B26_17180, partial [Eubacteriales bacterium]|nr:hypothetical protein [Eubacteriales bacterium]
MRKGMRRAAMIVLTGMTIAGMGMWGNVVNTAAEETTTETTNAAEEYYLDTLYYDQLTEEERTVYGDLYEAFTKHETEFFVFTPDYSMIYKMVDAIIEEHPEMFWIGTMYFQDFDVYEWDDQKSLCKCTYLFTKEEIEKYEVELEEVSEEFLEALPENGTTYQKVKAAFDYICDKTIYTEDIDDKYGQSLIGPLCYGESICVGYARALDFLLEKADISCVSIPLVQEHEANLVEIAGDVYYVDVTWGDDDSETQYQYL